MYGLNRFTGIGRLTDNPEIRYLSDGTPLCKMRLAFNRRYQSKDGQTRDRALFINCVAWKKLAELCSSRLSKGARVYAEGEIIRSTYDKKDGSKGENIEISASKMTFLDPMNKEAIAA